MTNNDVTTPPTPTAPTVEEQIAFVTRMANFCSGPVSVEFAAILTSLRSLQSLAKDAERYRYFRSRWERIAWQHGHIEDYDVISDDETVATDCNWGDEPIGRALDTAIDLARGET